ncbi:hypothetical protein ACP275_06G122300 [Erythranthe tilingii]
MENEVSKLDSPSLNSQICLKNSEWVAENVKGLDQSVNEMLLLIEDEEHISFEKVADNNSKQPDLIARVKEISERHHLLADHYKKLSGELSGGYVKSVNGLKNYEKPSFGSPLAPLFQTPDKKLTMHGVVEGEVVGSDISLSSGGGISDTTPGSESSSLSSDSDSESYYTSRGERSSSLSSGKMMKHEAIHMETEQENIRDIKTAEECEILQRRISDYERELKVSNEKLRTAEEEISQLRSELRNSEAVAVELGSLQAQLLSAKNQVKLHEFELEKENGRSLMLQRQIVDLESNLESEKMQVHELQGSVQKYAAELSDRNLDIKKLNAELQDASGNFALEKWQLESSVSNLSEQLKFHEAKTENLQMRCESLADQIKNFEAGKIEMERKQEAMNINWQNDIERVKAEVSEKNELVNTLNKNLDGLKLKYDMLSAEKDGVVAKLQTLIADLSARDNEIQRLEHNLNELHSENKVLNKLRDELKSRINELEKEVKMQAEMISDTSEEKREAIRQLCFSLDHFKSAYVELREECFMRKRPMAVVS